MFAKRHANNRSKHIQRVMLANILPCTIYPSLSMHGKIADIGSHRGSFAGLIDLCYLSYRCISVKLIKVGMQAE